MRAQTPCEGAAYERAVREHYASVIEPDYRARAEMDARMVRVALPCVFAVIAWIAWSTPSAPAANLLKVGAGFFVWSFVFGTIHAAYHVHMWAHRGILDQKAFAFYHHYVDLFMYSRYRARFQASQLEAVAFVVVPVMYVDNVLGATLLLAGTTDMFAHRWYHTRRSDRPREFHPIAFRAMTALERLGIIDTRAHHAIHHAHDMHHLDDVEGWMDVRWPIAGRLCDAIAGRLYRFFKDRAYGYHAMLLVILAVLLAVWWAIEPYAVRDANAQVMAFHGVVLAILVILGPARGLVRGLSTPAADAR